MVDYDTPASHTSSEASHTSIEAGSSVKSTRRKLSQADVDCLASAIGSNQVLEDFRAMINSVRDAGGKVDRGTARAFRAYERTRIHETLNQEAFLNGLSSSGQWSVEDALQFYRNKDPSTSLPAGKASSDDETATEVGLALQLNKGGIGYQKLGRLKQDIAAFHVARLFRKAQCAAQEEIDKMRRGQRRKDAPKGPPKKRGPQASKRAYAEIFQQCRFPDATIEADLNVAKYRGSRLLQYEAVCGRDHPLWMLLPVRNIRHSGEVTGKALHAK